MPEIFGVDIDQLAEKPWRESRDKMSDYFNYGMYNQFLTILKRF